MDYGISIHFLSAMTDAVEALANRNGYLLIVIMLHPASDLFHIQAGGRHHIRTAAGTEDPQ